MPPLPIFCASTDPPRSPQKPFNLTKILLSSIITTSSGRFDAIDRIIIPTTSLCPIRIDINRHRPNTQLPLPHHSFLSSHNPFVWISIPTKNSEFPRANVRFILSPAGHQSNNAFHPQTYQQKLDCPLNSPAIPPPPALGPTLPNCPISTLLVPLTLQCRLDLRDILLIYLYPTTSILNSI